MRNFARTMLVGLLALFVGATGCSSESSSPKTLPEIDRGTAWPAGWLEDVQAIVDGEERRYDFYAPEAHGETTAPSSVVVLLHGHGGSPSDLTGGRRGSAPYRIWQELADEHNLLLVIPQGSKGPDRRSGWNDCRQDADGNPSADDVAFIDAILDEITRSPYVHPDHFFAVGTSNGGHMAVRLAIESSHTFAGIGVVAAWMPVNTSCGPPTKPVSVAFILGTDDPFAPYNGGQMAASRGEVMSADASIAYWVEHNETSMTPISSVFADLDPGDSSTVERFLYEAGSYDATVALYRVNGGGHTEPSIAEQYGRLAQRVIGTQNNDIEMAVEVAEFFGLTDR